MQKINWKKNEKGAISLFVMLSMLFFLLFMLGAYTIVSRRNQAQIQATTELKNMYVKTEENKQVSYNERFTDDKEVILISNASEFELIGTDKSFEKNGRIYKCKTTSKYQLTNDIIIHIDKDVTKEGFNFNEHLLYGGKMDTSTSSGTLDTAGHRVLYYKDNTYWKCLLYQNSNASDGLFTASNAGYNTAKNSFSCLNKLDDSYKIDSKFEFMLMYNINNEPFTEARYNTWTQTVNPISVTEGVSLGYTAKHIGLTGGMTFGGIAKSAQTTSTFLNGDLASTWFYAIGTYAKWGNGVTGIPADSTDATKAATQCLLFVKVNI